MYTRFQVAPPKDFAPPLEQTQRPQATPVPVFAKWTGYVDGPPTSRAGFLSKVHVYRAVQRPERPLALGMLVKLYVVSPATYCSPDAPPDLYHAYDAHIIGTITRVAGWRGDTVGIEILNNCWRNAVATARLEIQYIPDVTVRRLAHLKAGKGPREAREDQLMRRLKMVLPLATWECGARQCAMREPGEVRDGVLCVYSLPGPGPEDESDLEPETRRPRRKHTRGNLEAIGWQIGDDT